MPARCPASFSPVPAHCKLTTLISAPRASGDPRWPSVLSFGKKDAYLVRSTLAYGFLILDSPYMTQKRRAQVGFLAWCLPMLASVCWMVANRTRYTKMDTLPAYDYRDPGWANGASCLRLLYHARGSSADAVQRICPSCFCRMSATGVNL